MLALNYIVAILGMLFGAVQDIRKREVSDWLNYSLIAFGIGFGVIKSLLDSDVFVFFGMLLGLAAGVAIGFAMYYLGQWGGGDSKMIMGLGAIIGLNIWQSDFFLPTFLINAVLFGAVYGVLWSIAAAVKNRKAF
ncbi:MAG: A24 family peptidase, partial [Candidatus Woesearchaeota archaeon]